MADNQSLTLEMITPERLVLRCQADFVVLPADRGEMGVLPGHEPFLVALREGEVRVTFEGNLKSYAIAGGFAEILRDKVSIFAETAEMSSEIDAEAARQAAEKASFDLARKDIDPVTLAGAEAALRFAQVKLRVTQRRHGRGDRNPPKPA